MSIKSNFDTISCRMLRYPAESIVRCQHPLANFLFPKISHTLQTFPIMCNNNMQVVGFFQCKVSTVVSCLNFFFIQHAKIALADHKNCFEDKIRFNSDFNFPMKKSNSSTGAPSYARLARPWFCRIERGSSNGGALPNFQ